MVPPFVLPAWADTNLRNIPPLPLLLRLKYAPFTTFYNIHIFSSFVTRTGVTLRPARTGCMQTRTQSHQDWKAQHGLQDSPWGAG